MVGFGAVMQIVFAHICMPQSCVRICRGERLGWLLQSECRMVRWVRSFDLARSFHHLMMVLVMGRRALFWNAESRCVMRRVLMFMSVTVQCPIPVGWWILNTICSRREREMLLRRCLVWLKS